MWSFDIIRKIISDLKMFFGNFHAMKFLSPCKGFISNRSPEETSNFFGRVGELAVSLSLCCWETARGRRRRLFVCLFFFVKLVQWCLCRYEEEIFEKWSTILVYQLDSNFVSFECIIWIEVLFFFYRLYWIQCVGIYFEWVKEIFCHQCWEKRE